MGHRISLRPHSRFANPQGVGNWRRHEVVSRIAHIFEGAGFDSVTSSDIGLLPGLRDAGSFDGAVEAVNQEIAARREERREERQARAARAQDRSARSRSILGGQS